MCRAEYVLVCRESAGSRQQCVYAPSCVWVAAAVCQWLWSAFLPAWLHTAEWDGGEQVERHRAANWLQRSSTCMPSGMACNSAGSGELSLWLSAVRQLGLTAIMVVAGRPTDMHLYHHRCHAVCISSRSWGRLCSACLATQVSSGSSCKWLELVLRDSGNSRTASSDLSVD